MAFYLKIQTHQDAKSLMVQRWLIEEGQYIDRLRPIVVIRADDEQVTIRAQRDGILLGKYVQDGESFERDDELATIISPEEAGRIKITRTLTARDREILNSLNRKPKHKHPHADHLRATPAARSLASQYGVSLFDVHGSGPDGRIQKSDVLRYVRAGEEDIKDKNQRVLKLAGKDTGSDEQSDQPTRRLKKVRISPLARKMAVSYGIDLKDVKSHGGKIGKEDVLDFLGLLTPAESASLAPEDTAQAQNTAASDRQAETVSTPQVEAVLEEAVLDEGPIDLTRLRQQAEADDIRTLQEAGRLETEEETSDEGPDEVDLAAEALRQEESRKLFEFFSRIAKDADGELMAVPTDVEKIKVAGQTEVPETAPEAGRVEEAEIVAHEAEMETLESESEAEPETEEPEAGTAGEAPEETSEEEAVSSQAEESEEASEDLFGDLTVALPDDMTEDESENDHETTAETPESETESDMHETTSQIKDDIRTEESRLMEELLAFARSQSTSVGMGGGGSAKTAEPGAQSEETKEEPEAAAQESEAQETGFVLKDSVDETKTVTEPSAEEAPAEEMNPSEAKKAAESESSEEPMLYLAPEGEFAYDGLHYNNLDEREALLSTSLFDLLGTPEADTIQIPDTDSIIELTGEMPEHALSEQAQMQEGPSEPKAHVDTPDVIALPQEPETETTEITTEDIKAQAAQAETPKAEDGSTEPVITPAPPAHEPDMDTMADRAIHAALAEPALFEDEDIDVTEASEQAEKPEHHPEISYDDLLYGSVKDGESESGQAAMDVVDFMSEELPDVASEPDAGEILREEILAALGLTGAEAEEVLELSTVEDGGLFEAAYARCTGTKAREQAYEALTTARPVPSETLTLSAEMRLDPIFSILGALESDPGHTLTYEPEDFILLSIRRALEAMTGEVLPILFQDVEQIYAVATSAQDLTSIHEALEACTPGSAKAPVTVVSLLATPVITASGAQKTMSPLVLTIGGLRTAASADAKTHHYARLNLETTALSLTQAGKLLQDILSALDYPSTMLIEKA